MPRWPDGYISKRKCPECHGPKDFSAITCRKCQPKPVGLAGVTGPDHPSWKGGRLIDRDGYVRVYVPDYEFRRSSPYMLEHVMVMEQHLGRRLQGDETVHHLDHDRQNNALENLQVIPRGSHSSHHRKLDVHKRRRKQGRFS